MSPAQRQALIIWLWHYVECEEYERTLPGHWMYGKETSDSWMPNDTIVARDHARWRETRAAAELAKYNIGKDPSHWITSQIWENAREEAKYYTYRNALATLFELDT